MAYPRAWPRSIREINDLPDAEKVAIYRSLIPPWVYSQFGIDPASHVIQGTRVVHIRCPRASANVEITIYHAPVATDPVIYFHMGDTFNAQIIVLLVVVNDPQSPRFNIDVDEHGRETQLGTRRRNIGEEIRAMRAGLGPGQVRRGLRFFRAALPIFERFVARMGHDLFFIEPLFYHNAITFERYGFAYAQGLRTMRIIHEEFQPGGALHARLDSSTPFRHRDAWQTILGRSWAIHDGIMNGAFTGVQMYKRVGVHAGIQTFPDARW